MKPSNILVGLAAGAAAALLFAGLVVQSSTAVGLALAAPIPVFIASLGWGSAAGFIAAVAGGLVLAAIAPSPYSSLTLLAAFAVPAAIAGHLAGLAQPVSGTGANDRPPTGPVDSKGLEWYPLERILFALAVCAALGCLSIGWYVDFDPEALQAGFVETLSQEGALPEDAATRQQIEAFAALVLDILPFVQPAVFVFVLTGCLYIAAAVVRLSGRMPRPKDDIPGETRLPRVAVAIMLAAIVGTFAGGTLGAVAAVVAGAFGAAFTLVGLARLHQRTRGRPGRGLMLFSIYAAIVLLTFPLLAFTVFGFVDTLKPRHSRP